MFATARLCSQLPIVAVKHYPRSQMRTATFTDSAHLALSMLGVGSSTLAGKHSIHRLSRLDLTPAVRHPRAIEGLMDKSVRGPYVRNLTTRFLSLVSVKLRIMRLRPLPLGRAPWTPHVHDCCALADLVNYAGKQRLRTTNIKQRNTTDGGLAEQRIYAVRLSSLCWSAGGAGCLHPRGPACAIALLRPCRPDSYSSPKNILGARPGVVVRTPALRCPETVARRMSSTLR